VQYQNLLTRLQDFEAQASLQVADGRVVSAALAPIEPSYPRKGLVLGIMAIVALGAGVGGCPATRVFHRRLRERRSGECGPECPAGLGHARSGGE